MCHAAHLTAHPFHPSLRRTFPDLEKSVSEGAVVSLQVGWRRWTGRATELVIEASKCMIGLFAGWVAFLCSGMMAAGYWMRMASTPCCPLSMEVNWPRSTATYLRAIRVACGAVPSYTSAGQVSLRQGASQLMSAPRDLAFISYSHENKVWFRRVSPSLSVRKMSAPR